MLWTEDNVDTRRQCLMPRLNIDESVARWNRSGQKHKNTVCWAESFLARVEPRVVILLRGAQEVVVDPGLPSPLPRGLSICLLLDSALTFSASS